MSVVLLLPAFALTAVTGINVYYAIAIMGFLATLYTVTGGIAAVIWTDVLQVGVLFGGALLALFFNLLAGVFGGIEMTFVNPPAGPAPPTATAPAP